ncbi:GNAT family N-acetyltransferase [bacterium]|nr:GNAT family N-acetyltransferase [bacterium]
MEKRVRIQFTTDRLTIRELHPSDAGFIVELLNEPAFIQNIGDKNVQTLSDAKDYIRSAGTENYERFGFGMLLASLSVPSTPVGICGLLQRDFLAYPDIGFAYLSRFHNLGLGTEAALAVRQWATTSLGIHKIAAFTVLTNKGSIRVLEKVGFHSLGEQDLPGKYGRCHVLEWQLERAPIDS